MNWHPCTCVVPTPIGPVPETAYTHSCSVCGGFYAVCPRCRDWLYNGKNHGLGHCEKPKQEPLTT